MSAPSAARVAALARRLRQEPARLTAQRVVRRVHDRLVTADLDFPLRREDVADSATTARTEAPSVAHDGPLTVGWLTTPPGRGSGGHTTMFRMVRALEEAGHRCEIVIYDRNGGPAERFAEVIRDGWPWVRAGVRSVDDGLDGLDACVATSWPTSHVLARRGGDRELHRLYFVQDFEPFFYPRGSEYELAVDSYRLGHRTIALGRMVHDRLRREVDVAAELVPFSCDTSVYRVDHRGPRRGVVFYAKPEIPRRGYRLAVLALEEFHRRNPDQPIHVYGHDAPDIEAPVVRHHRLTPEQLNELYNSAAAAIAMSFTNISLVTAELLASGCLPVVNDSADARADLDSPYVVWAAPTPSSLAAGLERAVALAADGSAATAASASVAGDDWSVAGAGVVRVVEETARGAVSVPEAGVVADAS